MKDAYYTADPKVDRGIHFKYRSYAQPHLSPRIERDVLIEGLKTVNQVYTRRHQAFVSFIFIDVSARRCLTTRRARWSSASPREAP